MEGKRIGWNWKDDEGKREYGKKWDKMKEWSLGGRQEGEGMMNKRNPGRASQKLKREWMRKKEEVRRVSQQRAEDQE